MSEMTQTQKDNLLRAQAFDAFKELALNMGGLQTDVASITFPVQDEAGTRFATVKLVLHKQDYTQEKMEEAADAWDFKLEDRAKRAEQAAKNKEKKTKKKEAE
jgi:hypothetical protein